MRNIALCMQLSDFYEHGIARGVVRYAKAKPDWRLFGYGWMFRSLESLDGWKGDGIIARIESEEQASRLDALGLPLVDVAGAHKRKSFRAVTNDDALTGRAAARHLEYCGFRRFAFLGVAGTGWSARRRSGFEDALGQAWPAFERELAWWEAQVEGDESLASFLRGLELPCALFACNDTTGLRATELARRLGIAVPESLAILGVDNEDILCELASPSLSSIALDCETIGYEAARALDSVLDGDGPAEGSRIEVPPRDVSERESTRVYCCPDQLVARAATYIRGHAHEGIDVDDILSVVAASRRSLEIRFREAMGRSLHDEIVRARLARAKKLMRESGEGLDSIASASGFGALGRFHAVFKELEGTSPGEWRKRNCGKP
ncbi:MAG: DNA-binding transcriptional regulator [Spirochaetaceae bacterium]|nr:DNA-binding transcriptional regulator [Spirochaetaceae bacterium]